MGIRGLPKLIQDIAGNFAIKSYKFSRFSGMSVAVDASLMIHQTVIAIRSSGKDMTNNQGRLTSHLHGLFYKILIFLLNKMIPIFVFDGKSPDIKSSTLIKRKQRKDQAEEKLKDLSDQDQEYIRNFKQTFKPTKEDMLEAQILLDLMGIPYIVAPGEADVVLSWLASRCDTNGKRYVKGVCSDDSDMLAFGAPYIFKDMLRFMNKNKNVKVISLNKALAKMKLTSVQFTDLCVLLGCDYCDNIKGIGPKRAYRLIYKYGTLEGVLKFINKNLNANMDPDRKANEKCLIAARNYFRNALTDLDESNNFIITDDQLKLRKYQYEELMDFMCVKHNFDVIKIQAGINRLDQYYKQLNVTKENTQKVHKILQPRSENYIFKTLADEIQFLPSEESGSDTEIEKFPSKKNIIPSKKKRDIGE